MAKSIVRATREDFDIAGIDVQGLMMPDGRYKMSDADIARAALRPSRSVGDLRKAKTLELNGGNTSDLESVGDLLEVLKVKVEGYGKPLNASSIEFAAMYWATQSANSPTALALTVALSTESIQRRFDRAFNQKVTEAEYDASLALRFARLNARKGWTDVVKERMIQFGYYQDRSRVCDEFKSLTVRVNMVHFGRPHFNCDRDNMTAEQQQLIGAFELVAKRKAARYPSATPAEIVELALRAF